MSCSPGALYDAMNWHLQVVESTGCVMTPYQQYPNLMGTLLSMLADRNNETLRYPVIIVRHSFLPVLKKISCALDALDFERHGMTSLCNNNAHFEDALLQRLAAIFVCDEICSGNLCRHHIY